jgi:phosphoglycolate phosphatase
MTKLVVFDVDGTLVDSQANILMAMADAFQRHELPIPDSHRVRRVVGLSLVEAMQELLPGAPSGLQQALAEDYKSAFQRLRGSGGLVHEPLFPGARTVIETLATAGIMLGLATGKSDRGLALCLETHDLSDFFSTRQTADRHPSKPHPAMLQAAMDDVGVEAASCWMVGDTVFDMEMAASAGARAIGVEWGYHASDELAHAGAQVILTAFDDLPVYLRAQGVLP